MNLVSKQRENQFNPRGMSIVLLTASDVSVSRLGQDILPLAFKLYPQRSESVDNSNRVSPSNNGLQRVRDDFPNFLASDFRNFPR